MAPIPQLDRLSFAISISPRCDIVLFSVIEKRKCCFIFFADEYNCCFSVSFARAQWFSFVSFFYFASFQVVISTDTLVWCQISTVDVMDSAHSPHGPSGFYLSSDRMTKSLSSQWTNFWLSFKCSVQNWHVCFSSVCYMSFCRSIPHVMFIHSLFTALIYPFSRHWQISKGLIWFLLQFYGFRWF